MRRGTIKKQSQREREKAIVANLKAVMARPRLTESVRIALEEEAALAYDPTLAAKTKTRRG
jgi:hypothetical protein